MKYLVVEKRISIMEYEIEADSCKDAEALIGRIISEHESDNYAYDLVSCEPMEREEEE
jgi:hypothetical protein